VSCLGSLKDAWCDTTTPHGVLMLTVLGGLAEFERTLIKARTGEGRERAPSQPRIHGSLIVMRPRVLAARRVFAATLALSGCLALARRHAEVRSTLAASARRDLAPGFYFGPEDSWETADHHPVSPGRNYSPLST
jgi:DNA invertase Pin-like site-specific DNA recombinase